jgi:hypothetical protein
VLRDACTIKAVRRVLFVAVTYRVVSRCVTLRCVMATAADKVSSLLQTSFGFKGVKNIAAWAVAGGIAYVWWIRPEQLRKQQEKVPVQRSPLLWTKNEHVLLMQEDCLTSKRTVVSQGELPPEVLRQVDEHVKKNA